MNKSNYGFPSTLSILRGTTLAGYSEVIQAPLIIGGVLTLDLTKGNIFNVAHNANITSLIILHASPNNASKLRLILTQDATGGRTLTLPSSVTWQSVFTPAFSTIGYTDNVIDLISVNNGGAWRGLYVGSWYPQVSGFAIFGYGFNAGNVSMTNLVSNTGVVATDTTGVGTARYYLAAAPYGTGFAIFGYGTTAGYLSMTNLVSNTGVVSSDTTGVGTARQGLAAAPYGGTGLAIFGYGANAGYLSMTNLVSNTGVVATDTTGVGTTRYSLAAAPY